MATVATAGKLMTAQEFYLLPEDGIRRELVRGRITTMNVPAPRHGYYCALIILLFGEFIRKHDLGRIMSNDSGVVTEHDPDTVRGPDVCYYSFQRLPKGPIPEGYLDIAPDAAWEVRSPTDNWIKTNEKVNDLLNAGVSVVCVHDPRTESITIVTSDGPPRVLYKGDTLSLPAIFPGLELPVTRFFE